MLALGLLEYSLKAGPIRQQPFEKSPSTKDLARTNSCTTIRHHATYLGENRGACPGSGVFGGRAQAAQASVLADSGGRRRTVLGRIPRLRRDSVSRRSQ